jgi:hypothetical protein
LSFEFGTLPASVIAPMTSDDSVYKPREWYGAEFEPRLVIVCIDYSYRYEICDRCLQALTKASGFPEGSTN